MNVDLIRFGRLASTPTVFHRNWLLLSRARNGSSSRNLSTFVDDRWEGEGGRDILIRWRSIIRTGFDIYILRRRIDEFSLGFGDGRRFWREREGEIVTWRREIQGEMFVPWREVSISIVLQSLCTKSDVMLFPFMHFWIIYIYISGEICNISWKHSSYTGIQGRCFEVALALKKAGKKECNR